MRGCVEWHMAAQWCLVTFAELGSISWALIRNCVDQMTPTTLLTIIGVVVQTNYI